MNNDPTPGTGENAKTTPDAGKNVDVSKVVSEALAAALAPVLENFSTLQRTVNGLAAEKRRATDGEPKDTADKKQAAKDPELAAYRDEVETLRKERIADKKRLAVKDVLDGYGDKIVGRVHLEQLLAQNLDVNSNGEVVALVDGKHVSLKDHAKKLAEDSIFRAPTGHSGTGKPEAGSGNRIQPEKTILASDQAAINANWRDIAAGKVKVVQG